MSITDELRKYAGELETAASMKSEHGFSPVAMKLTAIADHIDAEHQKAKDGWEAKNGDEWLKGYGECRAQLMEGNEIIAADLEKVGWVKLPVDADGVLIRVGDVLDGYGKTIEIMELRYGRSGWVLISRDGNGYADTFAFAHHRTPTVEDVLWEMLDEAKCKLHKDGSCEMGLTKEQTAKYAAKLRLAESEEQ